jgi:hemerythrin-like metal-binding protein/PAS domain S-box-containing protein
MDTFVWNDRYLTGEPRVDGEHRELVRIINRVGELQAEVPEQKEAIGEVIGQLANYAVVHFAHEEALMRETACDPRHAELHRTVHEDFARQVTLMSGDPHISLEFLLRFLSHWLSYHILGMDQTMARQIRRIRAGMTPAAAYAAERDEQSDPATASLLDALHGLYAVITQRNQELHGFNQTLERQVAERTQALQTSNTRLQREQDELKTALATVEQTQKRLIESEHRRAQEAKRYMEQLLAQIVDGDPVPTLVIDAEHRVTHWNRACATITGIPAGQMIGSDRHWSAFYPAERPILADLVLAQSFEHLERHYQDKCQRSAVIPDAFEAEDFFPHLGDNGRWLYFTAAPIRDPRGNIVGAIETLQDVTSRHRAEENLLKYQSHLEELVAQRTSELSVANRKLAADIVQREMAEEALRQRYEELQQLNRSLSQAQAQLLQQEKLASIGQLAAGVAHEINNPTGYVHSNIGTLENYLQDLFSLLAAYEAAEGEIGNPARREELQALRKRIDFPFLKEDIPNLMRETREGIIRVKKIVQDLKDFSRVDTTPEWQWADLHRGIDSTINIAANEIRYKADVVREYGDLPEIECLPMQLNQVFMNLLVNAAQAMGDERGRITIRSGVDGDRVWLEFADNGRGMSPEVQQRIFDPFYTTKPVGQGTGLGLSLSYGIIEQHCGSISVDSKPGRGTTFRIELPIRHPRDGEVGG